MNVTRKDKLNVRNNKSLKELYEEFEAKRSNQTGKEKKNLTERSTKKIASELKIENSLMAGFALSHAWQASGFSVTQSPVNPHGWP